MNGDGREQADGGGERDVISSLPHTRPQRRSSKRDGANGAGKGAATRSGAGAKGRAGTAKRAKAGARGAAGGRGAAGARSRPTAASSGRASTPSQGFETKASSPPQSRSIEPPNGAEIISTAVDAAGELAHAGLTITRQLVRSALSRLPRP